MGAFSGFIKDIAGQVPGLDYAPAQPLPSNSMTAAASQVPGMDYTPAAPGSDPNAQELLDIAMQAQKLGSGVGGVSGGGGTAVPARQPSALMTPRATVDRFPFAKSVAPGSLGEVFQQMAYQNRPDLASLRQQAPATTPTAPASRPTGQMMPQMAVPQPTYSPAAQSQNTMLSRFLSGRRSGGISDLLQARLGG